MAKKELFAIDIGSGKIRGAYAIVDENRNIIVRSIADSQYAGYTDGELLEPDNLQDDLQKVLNRLIENTEKDIKHLVVGVPSEFCGIVVKQVETFYSKPTLITDASVNSILEQAKNDLILEDHRILHADYVSFLDEDGDEISNPIGKAELMLRMEVSFAYATNEFCTYVENCLSNLGIDSVEFVASPLAQAQCLFTNSEREDGVLFMDNGFISSFVATIKGNGLTSLTSFSLGGAHISALLMDNLNIPYKQADELKHKILLTVNPIELDFYESDNVNSFLPIPARQVNRYVKLKVQQMANIAQKCLDHIRFDWLDEETNLFMTGSGLASIKGSREILGESLKRNVETVKSSINNLENLSMSACAYVGFGFMPSSSVTHLPQSSRIFTTES